MLQAASRLRVADEISIGFERHGLLLLKRDGAVLEAAPLALSILERFTTPCAYADALAALAPLALGRSAFIALTATIADLYRAGFLLDADTPGSSVRLPAEFGMHIDMLNDRARTECFLAAIAEQVKPGDVVVDLGTGTGILAMAAARAGAARVYAIEASAFADTAEAIVAANGYADVVRIVRGWSTSVELPERADVMVSEIIGNDPFAEGFLHFFADARRRFLKPGARLLPDRVSLGAYFAEADPRVVAQRRVADDDARQWRESYGFDFAPFLGETRRHTLRSYLTPTETANWPAISEGALLWSQSLADDASGASHEACFELLPARQPALIWHFDLHFGERRLSTDPRLKRPSHWRLPVDFPGVGAMRYRVELKLSAISHRLGSSITAL